MTKNGLLPRGMDYFDYFCTVIRGANPPKEQFLN